MARAKQLRPVDHITQSLLADAVRETGAKHADVGEKAGMSQNRVSIILRLGTPPATVGEISAIARAIGRSGSEFIAAAEAEVASAVAHSSSDRTDSVAPSLSVRNGARDAWEHDAGVAQGEQVLSLRPDAPPPPPLTAAAARTVTHRPEWGAEKARREREGYHGKPLRTEETTEGGEPDQRDLQASVDGEE